MVDVRIIYLKVIHSVSKILKLEIYNIMSNLPFHHRTDIGRKKESRQLCIFIE